MAQSLLQFRLLSGTPLWWHKLPPFSRASRSGTGRHPWVQHLRVEELDIGAGKRLLARGGVLDARFGIIVPREMAGRA